MSGEKCPTCGAAVKINGCKWIRCPDEPGSLKSVKRLISIAEEENKRLRVVLADLVRLKAIKDKHGKTPEYEAAQAMAWQAAREALGGEYVGS